MPDAGREREVEQLGELGADLAGVGVDRVAPDEHEVERAVVADRRRERACRRERVGARERRVGDEHAVDLDSRAIAHAIASRSVSSADGGPSVSTVHDPPCSATSATPWETARRQYGFISRSRPSRRSRPSGPSSISSNAGICLTRAAMRMERRAYPAKGFRPFPEYAVGSGGTRREGSPVQVREAVIVDTLRTAIGKRNDVDPARIDDVERLG